MKRLTLALLYCTALYVTPKAADFAIDPAADSDTVLFKSTAKLEFIKGKTNNIKGYFSFDPDSPGSDVSGIIHVDLRTLRTGIELRDSHMRERHLHTGKFPYAYFLMEKLSQMPDNIESDSLYKAEVSGTFYIHGFKRALSANLEFRYSSSDKNTGQIQARIKFSLKLDDYKIERPKALFMKLAEQINIELIFSARENQTTDKMQLPVWKLLE